MKWCQYIVLNLFLIMAILNQPLVGYADNPTGDTHVDLELIPYTGSVPVVKPEFPTDATTTYPEGDKTPNSTGLSLAYVTKGLDFGTQTINLMENQSCSPKSDSHFLWNNQFVIEIADGRGTHTGWTLSVNGNPFERVNNASDVQRDASTLYPTLSLLGMRIYSSLNDNGVSIDRNPVEIDLKDKSASQILVKASPKTGMGMTTVEIDPNDIKLNIPANSIKAGEYQTSLSWNLLNVP